MQITTDSWIFWIITVVLVGTLLGAVGFFIKKTIGDFEKNLASIVTSFKDRTDKLECRIAAQEERHNQLIKDLPSVYAYREDMIRYSQDTNSRLDRLQDLMMEVIKGGKHGG